MVHTLRRIMPVSGYGSSASPLHTSEARDKVEVTVTAQERKGVLTAEGCDPEVGGRDWLAFFL